MYGGAKGSAPGTQPIWLTELGAAYREPAAAERGGQPHNPAGAPTGQPDRTTGEAADDAVRAGLRRIVALYDRSPTSYQIC